MIKYVVKLLIFFKIKDIKIGEKEINFKSVLNEYLLFFDKVIVKYFLIEVVKIKFFVDIFK